MKKTGKILFYIPLLFFYFSCMQKKENIEQKHEILQEESKKNELYLFFDTEIKDRGYLKDINAGARNFYYRFKQTDSNDIIFEFSFFIDNNPSFPESEYRGFLKIDSFNIAIYDEKDLMTDFYKDSLCTESFPNRNYTGFKLETGMIMRILSTGWVNNNKMEILYGVEKSQEGDSFFDIWKYFE